MPKCPLCLVNGKDTELEKLTDDALYCSVDDITFKQQRGRVTVEPATKGKGKIQELEEAIAELQMSNAEMQKRLFGKTDLDLFGI